MLFYIKAIAVQTFDCQRVNIPEVQKGLLLYDATCMLNLFLLTLFSASLHVYAFPDTRGSLFDSVSKFCCSYFVSMSIPAKALILHVHLVKIPTVQWANDG